MSREVGILDPSHWWSVERVNWAGKGEDERGWKVNWELETKLEMSRS